MPCQKFFTVPPRYLDAGGWRSIRGHIATGKFRFVYSLDAPSVNIIRAQSACIPGLVKPSRKELLAVQVLRSMLADTLAKDRIVNYNL